MSENEQIIPSLENPLHSVTTVAKMFGVEEATVRAWIKTGKIKAVKVLGRWKVPNSEVVRIANEEFG